MSGLCIMFPFTKVETSEEKIVELSPPRSDSMDRSEHPHITVDEVQVNINPIDYDSDDEVDDEVSEINGLFEPKSLMEEQETVSSLEVEKESKETNDIELEITIEEESFVTTLCNLLSKCFKK